MANNNSGSPVVIANRPFRHDLSIEGLRTAQQAGLALARSNQEAVAQAYGASSDYATWLIEQIKHNTDIEIFLKTFGLGFHGEVISLTAGVPSLIIPRAKKPRGYIIINPNEVAGFSSTVTFFASLLRAAGVYNSTSFNVSAVSTVACFLDVTANAGGGTLTVDAQTQDPISGNWATSQADIFAGAAAIGTYYASIGSLGVDQNIRLVATVAVAAVTFSVGGVFKGGNVQTGANVYLGPSEDVNTTTGFPLLPGANQPIFLLDDVQVYAISPTNPQTIKVLHMQG